MERSILPPAHNLENGFNLVSMSNLTEQRDRLVDKGLCDHCLGRQFGMLGHGLENYERGRIARSQDILNEDDFSTNRVKSASPGGFCDLCKGFFDRLSVWVDRLLEQAGPYEFDTYLVGSRIPDAWLEREAQLRKEGGVEHAEPVKREANRLVGKSLSRQYDRDIEVDHDEPDVQFIVDLVEDRVVVIVSPLYLYGKYNKYSREIPQTVWYCRACRGSGCDRCDGTGKMYQTSVQEQIQAPFLSAADADEAVFHGAGREDIDARCLGKREFVLELKQPRRRNLDLSGCVETVNASTDDVEIFDVRRTSSSTVAKIKEQRADKTYRAIVDLEDDVDPDRLETLEELEGEIHQDTPARVDHRRATRTRTREVYRVEADRTAPAELELTVHAEAGTYIKELISGDDGRTVPNLADLLHTAATCRTLDVVEIDHRRSPS